MLQAVRLQEGSESFRWLLVQWYISRWSNLEPPCCEKIRFSTRAVKGR